MTPYQSNEGPALKTVNILGVPVTNLSLGDLVRYVEERVSKREKVRIGVVNAAKIVKMRRDGLLRNSVLSSDVVIADGASIVLAGRALAAPLAERVTGIDLMNRLLDSASRSGGRVYLLGATETVSTILESEVRKRYPGVVIAGKRNGYFDDNDEAGIVRDINAANADYLFIGISSPKKEVFMARWESELSATVIHGVGGSFDVMAGHVKRAPLWMQRAGLEWFFRLIQEPRRMAWRYISTNTVFLYMLVRELVRDRWSRIK